MRGRRVLVTGATGMIGASLVRRMVAVGDSVFALSRPGANRVRLETLHGQIEIVEVDYCDAAALAAVVKQADPEVAFHLASTPFNPPDIPATQHFAVNVTATVALLEAMRGLGGDRRVICAGSCAAYGEGRSIAEEAPAMPRTVLGAAKQAARVALETYARQFGLRTICLCLFTPFGPWEAPGRLIPHIIRSARAGRDIPLTEGRQERDFLAVDDAVEAFMRAMSADVAGGTTINICSGTPVAVRDLARKLLELLGNESRLELGALPTRPDEIQVISGHNGRAAELLGWSPTLSLEAGLRRSIEWIDANPEVLARLADPGRAG